MSPSLWSVVPNETHAYNKDAGGDEYYGWASSGTTTSKAQWQIAKIVYTGENWVEHFPRIDANSKYSDQPIFEWDECESYSYGILDT